MAGTVTYLPCFKDDMPKARSGRASEVCRRGDVSAYAQGFSLTEVHLKSPGGHSAMPPVKPTSVRHGCNRDATCSKARYTALK